MACQKELLTSSPQEVQGFFFLLPTKWPPSLYFLITWTISAISCLWPRNPGLPLCTCLAICLPRRSKWILDQNQIFLRHVSEKRGVCKFYSGHRHRAKNIITQSGNKSCEISVKFDLPSRDWSGQKALFLWTCIPYIIYILGKFLLWRTFSFLLRLEKWIDLSI